MGMALQGYIPENLVIYSRAPDSWHLNAMYDIGGYNAPASGTIETVKGRKGFPVDKAKNTGDSSTASRWASAKPLRARSKIAMLFDDVADAFEERPNGPMKNLRVFYLEERGEGGRAYKVIDEDCYVWDMREDVFMEALMTQGIKPGGYIGGEFVFGILGSQIRLVRVGSWLYDQLDAGSKRKALKTLGKDDLVVGTIYRNKAGKHALFCGWVHSAKAPNKKLGMWYELSRWGSDCTLDADWMSHYFWFKMTQSHTYVEVVSTVDIPADVVARVRGQYVTKMLDRMRDARDQAARYPRHSWGHTPAFTETGFLKDCLEMLTVTSIGEAVVTPTEVVPYI